MLIPRTTLDHDKYRIEAVIGRGGFGHVYRARERLTGETVAIKELVPTFADDQRMVQRFIQEARATLRLTHPHIARTHTIFQDGDTYYLAMEYLRGGSLGDRLKAGPWPVEEVVDTAVDLCEALHYAHEEGVVHCDIKPANVLFDERGRVYLADFGIAHVSAELMTRDFLTAPGTAMGTVRYMAPEQLEGVRDDRRVDIYAVCAMLYEMLAGRPYLDFYTDGTPGAQARNIDMIKAESPLPLRVTNPSVPEWLARVVDQGLQKAPDDRFGTARQLRVALQGGSEARMSPAPPAPPWHTWPRQAIEWLRNLPVAVALVVGLTMVALLTYRCISAWNAFGFAAIFRRTPTVTRRPIHSASPSPSMSDTASPTGNPTTTPGVTETASPSATPSRTPMPDRDEDEVLDDQDRCPDQPGSLELAGCPDSDKDSVPDRDDACPSSSGLAEFDGCPDSDEDGIPDPDDGCPDSFGLAGHNGCPPPDSPPTEAELGATLSRPADNATMVYVPDGDLLMGTDDEQLDYAVRLCNRFYGECERGWFENEQPAHSVTLDGFWLDRNEVTNAQFAAFLRVAGNQQEEGVTWLDLEADGCLIEQSRGQFRPKDGYNNHPAVEVSWHGAAAYCDWVGARLPTEAEWEYAARGPAESIFPWGDAFDGKRLNFCDRSCSEVWRAIDYDDGYDQTAPVRSFPTNASWCSACDMAGNVWEWVADWYDSEYYAHSRSDNPSGPETGRYKVMRGGAWNSDPNGVRSAFRYKYRPDGTWHNQGFRCAVDGE